MLTDKQQEVLGSLGFKGPALEADNIFGGRWICVYHKSYERGEVTRPNLWEIAAEKRRRAKAEAKQPDVGKVQPEESKLDNQGELL